MNLAGPVLKSDASEEFRQALRKIESKADRCNANLRLYALPQNYGIWIYLSYLAVFIESEFRKSSPRHFHLSALMSNLGAASQTVIGWIHQFGRPASKLIKLRWNPHDGQAAAMALSTALNYNAFVHAFPMWHKDYYFGELVDPDHVRFTVGHSLRQRQIIAHLQGHRPESGKHTKTWNEAIASTPQRGEMFNDILNRLTSAGKHKFRYADPWPLWIDIRSEYSEMMHRTHRRALDLDLGGYSIANVNAFQSALLAICATHEHLRSARTSISGTYPFSSGTLVRQRSNWIETIARLAEINDEKVANILRRLSNSA